MKMSDVMKEKGIGTEREYYTIDEILGAEIVITEALTPTSDIREYMTEKKEGNESFVYLCLGIKHTGEKDLHCTKTCMREIAIRLVSFPQWQGQRIRINRTGKGYDTIYTVTSLGMVPGGYVASPAVPKAPDMLQVARDPAILTLLRKAAPRGMEDRVFWVAAQTEEPDMGTCMSTVDKLKKEGKIVYHNGVWKAT